MIKQQRWRVLRASCALALAGCAGTPMQVPEAARQTPAWSLLGYRENSVRERSFSIAGSQVRAIERSMPPARLATRKIEPRTATEQRYQFQLAADGQVLQGACTDARAPREHSVVGFGKLTLSLVCTCRVGELDSVRLELLDSKGSVRLGDGSIYTVGAIRESEAGKKEPAPLGYAFTGEHGTGALERTGQGRAWPPAGLDGHATRELSCAYAALLLYRP